MAIRNIAVSGVDTVEKYKKVCELCGSEPSGNIYGRWEQKYPIVYDYDGRINDWKQQNYSHCTLYTYEEFLEKYDIKEAEDLYLDCDKRDLPECLGGTKDEFTVTEVKDGGKNSFYDFPAFVHNIDSLARYLRLNGAQFNVLKSLTSNLGARHNGTNCEREAKKCLHYAVENMLYDGYNASEILEQVKKQLEFELKL